MKILIIGSGGREHALAWKLTQSPHVTNVYVAPGNGGTATRAHNVDIPATDISALVGFAQERAIDLTVVGPEVPLVAGVVDAFTAANLRAFGPTAAAAQLEGSKAFAKRFMIEEGIPTAPAGIFTEYEAARAYLAQTDGPIVVKASGLAAGKGVLVCDTHAQAQAALRQVMVDRAFGPAGDEVLIEARLEGEEASLLAFSDGTTVVPMLPARDYKRALDGDEGLNTGGMGGYAPSPYLTPALIQEVHRRVLQPAVDGMRRRGTPYVGVLYAGIMLTAHGPRVLEFNCRFGDPETQLLLPLLETDLVEIVLACIEGRLASVPVSWKPGYNVGVVMASGGYPVGYEKGKAITGLDAAAQTADVLFHAGTQRKGDATVTSGGRVLAVTATGPTIAEARARAYAAVESLHFEKQHYRTDIAASDALPPSIETESAPSTKSGESAYAAAGVDIEAKMGAFQRMKSTVQRTYTPAVLDGIGAFGGSIRVTELAQGRDLVLVASTDGVGTKSMIAAQMGIYDTVGHDIVNHCINDVLVQGARPLFFLDYVASGKLEPDVIVEIVGGCAEACRAANCVLIGGETAEMPGVYHTGTFDLVGTLVGWVARDELITGSDVRPGDICLGLPSTGLHTNGYSLARHVFAGVGWETVLLEPGQPLGEVLLTPHRAYLDEFEALAAAGVTVKAMSHVTGGSFPDNLPRVLPEGVGAQLDRTAWDVPPIFRLIQERGDVDEMEMYHVFNMGIGLVVLVAPEDVDRALAAVPEATVIGETIPWDGTSTQVLL